MRVLSHLFGIVRARFVVFDAVAVCVLTLPAGKGDSDIDCL